VGIKDSELKARKEETEGRMMSEKQRVRDEKKYILFNIRYIDILIILLYHLFQKLRIIIYLSSYL